MGIKINNPEWNKPNPLIIALDVNDPQRALELVNTLRPCAGMFKVGMELFYSAGGEIVRRIKEKGCRVFLDLKLHDIPNTVSGAARALTGLGADIINVHASGGPEMMKAALSAVEDEAGRMGIKRPLVVAVTVLTSINRETFEKKLGMAGDIEHFVRRWAALAMKSGLDGVVASPLEAAAVREECGPGFVIITPGVRPSWSSAGDQKRITTPAMAVAAGASHIVVGRPVTESAYPREAAEKILEELKGCVV